MEAAVNYFRTIKRDEQIWALMDLGRAPCEIVRILELTTVDIVYKSNARRRKLHAEQLCRTLPKFGGTKNRLTG